MWSSLIYYKLSINALAYTRSLTATKVCYKPALKFLKFKTNLTNSISNRLVVHSNYLCSYKNIRYFYINVMRTNFLPQVNHASFIYYLKGFDNKKFLITYLQSKMMREFDHCLIWRASQVNSLFSMFVKIKKKKKKITFTERIVFLPPHKRLLIVWKWLSVFIRSLKSKNLPRSLTLHKGFENFLLATEENHVITDYKLQIYKLHLLRIS